MDVMGDWNRQKGTTFSIGTIAEFISRPQTLTPNTNVNAKNVKGYKENYRLETANQRRKKKTGINRT